MRHRAGPLHPRQGRILALRVPPYPHVVRVGDALVFIKALRQGHELRLVAEVPFAEATGGVARLFQDLRNGDLAWVETPFVGGENHAPPHPNAVRIATGEQCGTGRGAGGRADVEVGQLHPFLRHPVEVGSRVIRTKRTDVPVAHVINEDDHDVGLLFAGASFFLGLGDVVWNGSELRSLLETLGSFVDLGFVPAKPCEVLRHLFVQLTGKLRFFLGEVFAFPDIGLEVEKKGFPGVEILDQLVIALHDGYVMRWSRLGELEDQKRILSLDGVFAAAFQMSGEIGPLDPCGNFLSRSDQA